MKIFLSLLLVLITSYSYSQHNIKITVQDRVDIKDTLRLGSVAIHDFTTDTALATNSNHKLPTEQATVNYVLNHIPNLFFSFRFKGDGTQASPIDINLDSAYLAQQGANAKIGVRWVGTNDGTGIKGGTITDSGRLFIDTSGIISTKAYLNYRLSVVNARVDSMKTALTTLNNTVNNLAAGGGSLSTGKLDTIYRTTPTTTYSSWSQYSISNGDTSLVLGNSPWVVINPPFLINNLRIVFPPNPLQGQDVLISFGGIITTGIVVNNITFVPNSGQTVVRTRVTPVEADESVRFKYNIPNTKWYTIQ